ncbi:MAG TPA: Hsp33 family molecular chaperone HslO [Syntrophomonadaceae bacterium]|nr:Hsp33 family molecular chaperone HslO [Syntrophomonadaceae bacterium]
MIDKDYLIKAIDTENQFRITLAHTTSLVKEAHTRHNTSATASAALGRVLTAALMMGSDLKGEEDILTLRIVGDGKLGAVVATVDSHGNGRGLVSNPAADLPSKYTGKLDVGGIVGREGYLEVIKDIGLKQPFVGRIPLVSGEIAEDLAEYFAMSEQIPALVSLGVLVGQNLDIKASGGILIQAMPGADDSLLEKVEKNVLNIGPVSKLVLENDNLEDILSHIMEGIDYKVLYKNLLNFKCTCNRDRLKVILSSFTAGELREIYEKENVLEARCNFCNEVYHYEIEEVLVEKDKKP